MGLAGESRFQKADWIVAESEGLFDARCFSGIRVIRGRLRFPRDGRHRCAGLRCWSNVEGQVADVPTGKLRDAESEIIVRFADWHSFLPKRIERFQALGADLLHDRVIVEIETCADGARRGRRGSKEHFAYRLD